MGRFARYDIESVAVAAGVDVSARLRELLSRAQKAVTVRADVGHDAVKALTAVALTRPGDAATLDPVVAVSCDGLRCGLT
ncbi:hypothetical protein [Frankia sp. AgB32]|uniref:SbtR family transcriptional regulator n=1 Tax=Frankia sp. AgB32 TaxID=631119 RepID=UPI00200CED6E|nr:hypothetical protein [Frankia sp. AgB32]MCK9895827.1 hypothetical protein [Frankia sp. AgB32]